MTVQFLCVSFLQKEAFLRTTIILLSITSFLGARELVITRDGEVAQTQDISDWTPGDEFLFLEGEPYNNYYYPWSGEDSIDYKVDEQGLWVGGKLRGFNVYDLEPAAVKTPLDIITAISTADKLGELTRFPHLVALSISRLEGESMVGGLKKLPGLLFLELSAGPYAEEGIEALTSLRELRELDASFAILPAGATKYLRGLSKLKKLSLGMVPDEEMLYIKGLKNLESLSRFYIPVDTLWLEILATLPNLRELSVIQAELSDEVLDLLVRKNQLERFNLTYSGIDDEKIKYIGKMTNLVELDLYGTPLSDSGLKDLERLVNLKRLWLGGPDLSTDAVATLQKKLPGCKIWFDE